MSGAMPPTPSSSGRSPISQTATTPDAQHRIVRKRNRVPLSCGPCRSRKLKCNRSHPCDNCTKRGDTTSCSYAAPGSRRRTTNVDGGPTSPDEMQNRIDRLESLVLAMMTNGQQGGNPEAAPPAMMTSSRNAESTDLSQQDIEEMDEDAQVRSLRDEDSEVERVSKDMGVMKVYNDRQIYASDGHWYAILSDIAEVKNYFAEHRKQFEDQARKIADFKEREATVGTSMLFKGTARLDKGAILSHFPPRQVANQLINRYFETENPSAHIIHRPVFCKQYDQYWQAPQQTSVVWIGQCYAMMCLALQSYHRAGDEPADYRGRSWEHSLSYLEWTTQCLVHTDFTQPISFMVETLCLYLQAEHARSKDSETGVWILAGIVVRLAMRIGLHRDPEPYQAISPFQGEMRRRIWNFIRSADVLLSHQCGMPSLIKTIDCDTALPTNIGDDEFDDNTALLPPARPLSETTPMSFMIITCHLTFTLGKILEDSSALQAMSYETAMKLDNDLREVRTHIPSHLQMKTREETSLDSASLIMQRYQLELLYLKSQTSLHRKFISASRTNTRYAYSRRTCVDACLSMLKHQIALHKECQPGGRLHSIPWSVTSVLAQHDFLLAAMIICLDLYHTAQAETKGQQMDEMYSWSLERRDEMLASIEQVVRIWEGLRDQSMEALKASTILSVMLDKLRSHTALRAQLSKNFSFVSQGGGVAPDQNLTQDHSAAIALGMMSSGMTPETMSGMYGQGYQQQQQQQQRTGLTPQPTSSQEQQQQQQQQPGLATQPAPVDGFANLFSGMGTFPGFDQAQGNWDWETLDSYIQGSGMEGSGQAGMMFDPAFDGIGTGQAMPQPQAQTNGGAESTKMQTSNLFAPGNAPFMPMAGAGTNGA